MTAGTGSSGIGSSGSTAGIGSPGMTAGTGSSGTGSSGIDSGHRVNWPNGIIRLGIRLNGRHQAEWRHQAG
ncbi:unnamed protein product [Staurois parvus]|uniref:Uncharacterized protein n=1 Tax=Staurois parvus TaxID=386267 RepID=A0ABN9GSH0_9NEOB|nr:unnamed protein product [Staurois parvus]